MGASLEEVLRSGVAHMRETTRLAFSTVVAIEPVNDGWHLQLEFVEKESIPHGMDVLGLYDAWLDQGGNLQRFGRRSIRRRADVSAEG